MQAELMQPDVDVTGLEEFSVPCDVQVSLVILGRPMGVAKQCDHEATWTANRPCCAHVVLTCDDHRKSTIPWFCPECQKAFPDLLNWRKL